MGSVYRKTKSSKRWSIAWTDEEGRRRSRVAFADQRASRKLLADLETAVVQRRSGLVDPFEGHRSKPLRDHVYAYAEHLEAHGCSRKYVRTTTVRLERALEIMGVEKLDGIGDARLSRLILVLRRRLALGTVTEYVAALRSFGTWLEMDRRAPQNPFRTLQRPRTDGDPRRVRMALTLEDLDRLTEPLVNTYRVTEFTSAKFRRGVLYRFAAFTGLRANECRTLTWADLELWGPVPKVVVRGKWAKNRRTEQVPIAESVAVLLRAMEDEVRHENRVETTPGPGEPEDWRAADRWEIAKLRVFKVPDGIARTLRADAQRVGLPIEDARGARLDFHSLRVSCATILARAGVPITVAQRILRHSDPKLTARTYTKLNLDDVHKAVANLGAKET